MPEQEIQTQTATEPAAAPAPQPEPTPEPQPAPEPKQEPAPEPKPAREVRPRHRNSRDAAIQAARERAAELAKSESKPGPARDPETGKFLPAQSGEEPTKTVEEPAATQRADVPTEEPAAEPRAADSEPAPEQAASGVKRVPIQDDHPVREMGSREIKVVDEMDEQVVRALLKGVYHRRKDVEEGERKVETVTKENERLRAQLAERERQEAESSKTVVRTEAYHKAFEQFKTLPEYKTYVDDYKAYREQEEDGSLPEGSASRYWEGVSARAQAYAEQQAQKTVQSKEQEHADRVIQQQAQAWYGEALKRVESAPEVVRNLPEFLTWFDEEVELLNHRLEVGHLKDVQPDQLHDLFIRQFQARLRSEPAVAQAVKAAAEAAQAPPEDGGTHLEQMLADARKQAVEEYKREVTQRHGAAPPNPLTQVGHVPKPVTPEQPDKAISARSYNELRGKVMQRARDEARRRFAGT